jgi:hypothetical protein
MATKRKGTVKGKKYELLIVLADGSFLEPSPRILRDIMRGGLNFGEPWKGSQTLRLSDAVTAAGCTVLMNRLRRNADLGDVQTARKLGQKGDGTR